MEIITLNTLVYISTPKNPFYSSEDNDGSINVLVKFLGRDSDEETLDQSEIRVWLDMSNQQIGLMLNRDLQFAYRDFAQVHFSFYLLLLYFLNNSN